MFRIKEILRVRLFQGLSQEATAAHCGIAKSTVWGYEHQARNAGLTWAAIEGLGDDEILARLSRPKSVPQEGAKRMPNWATIVTEMDRKGMTRHLLWEEYYEVDPPNSYRYTQFCELYARYLESQDLRMHQEHKPGERAFVDYSGLTVSIFNRKTGEIDFEAEIFVMVLGFSNFTFAEATRSQTLEDWLGSHVRAFRYFSSVPLILVPDNLKSAVIKAHRQRPVLNKSYYSLTEHYHCVIEPARAKKPRDKAKVENGVLIVQRWILMALRKQTFFDINVLNERIRELLVIFNDKPLKDGRGTRREVFEKFDKPAMIALPAHEYPVAIWKRAKANPEYHVRVDKKFYSVPYQHRSKEVEVLAGTFIVEIFLNGLRIALHQRILDGKKYRTDPAHLHPDHAAWGGWTTERLLGWAKTYGPRTVEYIDAFILQRHFPVQAYGASRGVLKLGKLYGAARMDAACELAHRLRLFGSHDVESILTRGRDKLPAAPATQLALPQDHPNIRGGDYYQ